MEELVEEGKVVTLTYTIYDEAGAPADFATDDEPYCYVQGYAHVMPGLEQRLRGHAAGDRLEVDLTAEQAFGEFDKEGVFEVDRSQFPESWEVEEGDPFVGEGLDGEPIAMRVLEVKDDVLVVDTNHPLAGQKVHVVVEILEVRQATDEEIERAKEGLSPDGGRSLAPPSG